MADRWVNAVMTLVMPIDVSPDASNDEKLDAAIEAMEPAEDAAIEVLEEADPTGITGSISWENSHHG